jgi:muramoyltetrapeptide carboxypeptidase LdcA involved in peptidoglycan recycling
MRSMSKVPESSVRPTLRSPLCAQRGDRVAILSPSWAGPGVHPEVHDIALRVLRDVLELEPVEFDTTRMVDATPEARAHDVMAAFADSTITAVLASIGGSDQLTVLPFLDPDVLAASPTRFFGYSDNTNLLNYLWNLGIIGYHGGSTMVHLARAGGPHPLSLGSLTSALFTNDTVPLRPVEEFTDLHPDWNDVATLRAPLATTQDVAWEWRNADRVVTGPTWGGNLEILHWNLAADRWMQPVETYRGCVLLLETSEEMPSSGEVFRMLRNFGERGLLEQFPAVVVAKPKSWNSSTPLDEAQRVRFRSEQRGAVLRALDCYNPDALVVLGADFGHTDPQYIVPYGGVMNVNGPEETISMTY